MTKLTNLKILRVKKYYLLNNVIKYKKLNFTYPPPEKIFKKQIKTLHDQEEMEIKETEDHGKSLKTLESNNQISSNKINVEFIKEKETKISESKEDINYGKLTFETSTTKIYDLGEYKKVNRFI